MDFDIDDILDFLESDLFDGLMAGMGFGGAVMGSMLDSAIKAPGGNEPIAEIQKEQMENAAKAEALKGDLEKLEQEKTGDEAELKEIQDKVEKVFYTKARSRIAEISDEPVFVASYQPRQNLLHGKLGEINERRGILLRAVFHAIESDYQEGKLEGLDYYTLDIPMPVGNDPDMVKLVRIIRNPQESEIKGYLVKKEKPYELEPMFPRLFMKGNKEPLELPQSTRLKACQNFYPFTENKNPFTERQGEILQLLLENPKWSSSKLAAKLHLGKSTADEHMKNIGKTGFRLFAIGFRPGKLLAHYWQEMGFTFV